MTIGDVVILLLIGAILIVVAFFGAFMVGALICAGVFLAKWLSKNAPKLWEKIL